MTVKIRRLGTTEDWKKAGSCVPGIIYEGSDGSTVWVVAGHGVNNHYVCLENGRELEAHCAYWSTYLEGSGVTLKPAPEGCTYELEN